MPPSRPPAERTLLGTTDASLWAEEFCRIFQGKIIGGPIAKGDVDEGTMLSWFANAIETGRDAGANWALDAEPEEVEEAEEIEEEDSDDDEIEPTLEEKFKEGFDEGRA
jgi:hypothetical protein